MPISETLIISLVERGIVPDVIIRAGIRQRLRKTTLGELPMSDCEAAAEHKQAFIAMLDDSPVAAVPERANEQHYEVPAEFFATVLGPRRKYSSCWWPTGVTTLEQAEEASLAETARRAGIGADMAVLELGCGWGSFSLWAAEQFPSSRFTAVSNSSSQRAYIEAEAERRGIENLTVITADMNVFAIDQTFRSHRLAGDVRAHAQLAHAVWSRARLAQARRALLHACVLPSRSSLSLRGHRPG